MTGLAGHQTKWQEVIGLVPAAGQATRIAPLPCSKEILPVGFRHLGPDGSVRPKVVCHYLLEKMRRAGVTRVFLILRHGKWDIPAYLGDGTLVDMHLAYLMMRAPFGAPYSLDQAYAFVRNALVVFGFPDILFQPKDAFLQLIARQASTRADVVLGLFSAHNPLEMDMVAVAEGGVVRSIDLKPRQTHLQQAWLIAVWTPTFTHFMHEYLSDRTDPGEEPELSVGHVLQAAICSGLQMQAVQFPGHTYLDIGTPDSLRAAFTDPRFIAT